jgi:hypothetical protein
MSGGNGIVHKSSRKYAILLTRGRAVVNRSKPRAVVGHGKAPGIMRLAKWCPNTIPFHANTIDRYSFVSQFWTRPGLRKSHPVSRIAMI